MKIVLRSHVINDKIPLIKTWGWEVTKDQINSIIKKPKWRGVSRFGQPTVMGLLDENHILRIIYEKKGGIINVITIHPAKRGKYESTKED